MKTFKDLFLIEIKLSFRDMNMIIFAWCMPSVITIVLGLLYNDSPLIAGTKYTFLEQSFGSLSSVAICASGVMGLPLVISEYRQKKILKRFKVTPMSPTILLFVQTCIYIFYSITSVIFVYLLGKLFFNWQFHGSLLLFSSAYLLTMLSIFSLGLLVGGISKNAKIASILCSLLYFPMLLFSGTTVPYEIMPKSLQIFSDVMPLTQGIKLLKATSLGLPISDVTTPIIIMIVLMLICTTIAIKKFKWE